MARAAKISVVLPVRDGEDRIASRVEHVLEALKSLVTEQYEVIVVDDGSSDATAVVLAELTDLYAHVRVARHGRPRGMEAAGQTGLERATGDLVFIQEADTMVRIDDFRRLYRMSEDETVVAARAESTPRPVSDALLRRLRAWGTSADEQIDAPPTRTEKASMQMIRRPHLQRLASRGGENFRLAAETSFSTSLEPVANV